MPQSSVLIVPALPVEAKAILSFFEDVNVKSAPGGSSYMTGKRKIFSTKLGEKLKERWTFYVATPTGAGNVEMAGALHRIIPECEPQIVALIGCAGGFPEKIEQYDVVVPPRIDYIARTKIAATTEYRPHQESCSNVFVDHCKNVQLLDLWHHYLLPDVSNAPINVLFEPIISGETVLANSRSEFFRSVLSASPRAVAIEMESYGFLSVCREYRVEAAVLRGISDTLDDKNAVNGDERPNRPGFDQAQYRATRHAAALFFATLDFVNASAFSGKAARAKQERTEVSLILDAEMHDVPEIQADLFELFKKYGIRNFSFRPANSIRGTYEADHDAMHIYEALVRAGIVKSFAGFKIRSFEVTSARPTHQLAGVLARIEEMKGASIADVLRTMRAENWVAAFPDHTSIIVDALEHQQQEDRKARKRAGRFLYPRTDIRGEEIRLEKHLGQRSLPDVVLARRSELSEMLKKHRASAPDSWPLGFMGTGLLDREIRIDVLLAYSGQKFFYSWPSLGAIFAATNLSEKAFIDGCMAEWQIMRQNPTPTILQILDQDKLDRLGRGQIQEAMANRPATLNKATQILRLTGRILYQNDLHVSGCIIPSLYVLTFNGTIAGDGAVERMLLTGMAGDLAHVARQTGFSLVGVQSAIRGGTLPYKAATDLADAIDHLILKNTRLKVGAALLEADPAPGRRRDAITLTPDAVRHYLEP
jgi:nucleoside phosphorylase